MGELKGTNVPALVVPYTENDKYATHDETFGKGGYRSVNSISEMNAIPSERRKEGMLVNVIGDKIYKLSNGSFVDAGLGSGGSSGENTPVIYLSYDKLYNLSVNTSTTSAQIISGIGQANLDKILSAGKLYIVITGIMGVGSVYTERQMILISTDQLQALIPAFNNQSFIISYINGVYSIDKDKYIQFDSDINNYSTSAPQTKAVYDALASKQNSLVSGTNIKTINGNSILGSGNIQITGGSGGGEVYVTSLEFDNIYDDDALTQAQYIELVAIYNKWKAGVPVIMKGLKYNGILNIYTNSTTFNSQTLISITLLGLGVIREWNVKMTIGSLWHLTFAKGSIPLNFVDIPLSDGYNGTTIDGDELYGTFKTFELNKNGQNPIYVTGIDGWLGVNIPIESSEMDQQFYITFYGRKYLVQYEINMDDIAFSVSDITKYDLSIEVKTASDGIYYRIKESVPNGYIQFVRKKRHRYYPKRLNYTEIKRTDYSVFGLYYRAIDFGVKAITLIPGTWYKFPIEKERLYNKWMKGSKIEGIPAVRNNNTIRLCGNTHAKPIEYGDNGTVYNLRKTSVLHAGLQYNILHPNFLNKVSPNVIFKQRGEIVPIDVRMTVDPKNFNLNPVLYFAVQ